mgnify:CR=1 FL=1
MLRRLEQLKQREGNEKVFKEKLRALVKEHMPLRQSSDNFHADRRKDVISHFILRLAYSQTGDLRRWFINQECHLLAYRVEQLSNEERAKFMSANGIDYEEIDGRRQKYNYIPLPCQFSFASLLQHCVCVCFHVYTSRCNSFGVSIY